MRKIISEKAYSRDAAVKVMKPYTITDGAGARPNFMKIAPIVRALNARKGEAAAAGIDLRVSIVHTGQHYNENMSEVFFRELAIPTPDHHLEAGSGSHAEQTARIMMHCEKVSQDDRKKIPILTPLQEVTMAAEGRSRFRGGFTC